MKNNTIIILVFLFGLALSYPTLASANITDLASDNMASITIMPKSDSFLGPDTLIIDLNIDPAGQAINLAYADLNYNKDLLTLENVDYANSFCDQKILEISDPENGNLIIACGTEKNDKSATSTLVRLTFNKIATGMAAFSFNNSSLLAADGLGTEINATAEPHYIEIVK